MGAAVGNVNVNGGIAMQQINQHQHHDGHPHGMNPMNPMHHANGLSYELEFEEGGEGGGQAQAHNNNNHNNNNNQHGRNVPRAAIPSISVNSHVPSPYGGVYGVAGVPGVPSRGGSDRHFNQGGNGNGNMNGNGMPPNSLGNRSHGRSMNQPRSMSLQEDGGALGNNGNIANNNNSNNNRNRGNSHNIEESVSISVTISENQLNESMPIDSPPSGVPPNHRQSSRPAALSDPNRGGKSGGNGKTKSGGGDKHVRQVSFPAQFLGFARRASSGILQVMADKDEECCICLGSFDKEDDIATLQCFHYFHKECIVDWLQNEKPECPVCNTSATVQGGKPSPGN